MRQARPAVKPLVDPTITPALDDRAVRQLAQRLIRAYPKRAWEFRKKRDMVLLVKGVLPHVRTGVWAVADLPTYLESAAAGVVRANGPGGPQILTLGRVPDVEVIATADVWARCFTRNVASVAFRIPTELAAAPEVPLASVEQLLLTILGRDTTPFANNPLGRVRLRLTVDRLLPTVTLCMQGRER